MLLATADGALLSRLYSLANFLQNTGSFLRMLASLDGLVRQQLQVVHSVPPQGKDAAYAEEVIGYMCDHFQQFERARKEGPRQAGGERSVRLYRESLGRLRTICNGAWTEHGLLRHHCMGCCSSLEETQKKVKEALQSVVFRRSLSAPARNKWTKLGPVLDTLLLGTLCHGVFTSAFLTLSLPRSRRNTHAADADLDPELQQDSKASPQAAELGCLRGRLSRSCKVIWQMQ